MSNDAISVSSGTKTKTAQLSGNDYSVEMRQINRLSLEQMRKNQGTDFEDKVNQCESGHAPMGSDFSAPSGFGNELSLAPPGFGGPCPPSVSPFRKVKASQGPKSPPVVSRVSKSQMKKGRKKVIRSPNNAARNSSEMKCQMCG